MNKKYYGCTSMQSVELGNGLTNIGRYAFGNCSALSSISIPSSVTNVGDYVFDDCTAMTKVVIEDRTEALSLGTNGSEPLFADCPLNSVYIGGKISYSTKSSDGYSPFYRNTTLESVVISDHEDTVYDNEFYGCTGLKNVTIGNGVKSIGNWAFSGCSSLDKFSFGGNVESIGKEAFSDCTGMTQLISYAVTPPTCGAQALEDINKWECTLKVPESCKAAYQEADQWKDFLFTEDVLAVQKYTLTYTVDGEIYHTESIALNAAIPTIETPTKEGHTFNGWSELPTKMPAHDVTVEGSFTVNTYTVTYILEGETFTVEQVLYGTAIPVLEVPTKEGYTFSGWSEMPATMPAKDLTLTGHYTINKNQQYKLFYVVDGVQYKQITIDFGTPIVLEEEPIKEGYTFSGWSEVPETMPAHDVTVEGSFTVNSYTLSYIVDGEEYKTVELEYGASIIAEEAPAKEGYFFSGWNGLPQIMPAHDVTVTGMFIQSSGGNIQLETKDGQVIANGSTVVIEGNMVDMVIWGLFESNLYVRNLADRELGVYVQMKTIKGETQISWGGGCVPVQEGDSYTTSLGMLEAHSLASLGIESTPMTSDYMNVVVIQTIEITLWTDENPNEKISATVTFTNDVDGIEETVIDNLVDVYTLQGVIVKRQISVKDLETELPSGIYIVGGKKFVVK